MPSPIGDVTDRAADAPSSTREDDGAEDPVAEGC